MVVFCIDLTNEPLSEESDRGFYRYRTMYTYAYQPTATVALVTDSIYMSIPDNLIALKRDNRE